MPSKASNNASASRGQAKKTEPLQQKGRQNEPFSNEKNVPSQESKILGKDSSKTK